jgi:hypothetical protein
MIAGAAGEVEGVIGGDPLTVRCLSKTRLLVFVHGVSNSVSTDRDRPQDPARTARLRTLLE